MREIKFIKFADLEEKVRDRISGKFQEIKDTDIIYYESPEHSTKDIFEKLNDLYVVTGIDDFGIDIAEARTGEKSCFGMDDEVKKALEDVKEGFTIYSTASDDEGDKAENQKEEKAAETADTEADKFEEVEITRKCGHKEIAKIRRTSDEDYREYLIYEEIRKRPLCHDCWEKDAKEKSKKAKNESKKKGYPALTGSAKQKKWAEAIRAEKMSEMSKDPSQFEVMQWYLINYTKASDWIDIRFMDYYEMRSNMKMEIGLKKRKEEKQK